MVLEFKFSTKGLENAVILRRVFRETVAGPSGAFPSLFPLRASNKEYAPSPFRQAAVTQGTDHDILTQECAAPPHKDGRDY